MYGGKKWENCISKYNSGMMFLFPWLEYFSNSLRDTWHLFKVMRDYALASSVLPHRQAHLNSLVKLL